MLRKKFFEIVNITSRVEQTDVQFYINVNNVTRIIAYEPNIYVIRRC